MHRGPRLTRFSNPSDMPRAGRWQIMPRVATSKYSPYGQRIYDVGLDVETPTTFHHWNLRWWGKPTRSNQQ